MKYVGLYDNAKDIVTKEKLDAKQDKITASGILKGDGAGGISKAFANRDYATCTNLRNGIADDSLQTLNSQSEGRCAMAEGIGTTASGIASHSEGNGTIASGNVSHTEGESTEATGESSHAEGFFAIANHRSQHAQGEYNIADDSTADTGERGNYAHIVGNGTASNARSNAHTLDWSGNAWFAGDVYVGSTSGTNKDDGSKKLITADEVPSEVFFATYGTTTYEEIKAAYDAGKVVLCRDGTLLVPLSLCTRSVATFSSCSRGIVTTIIRNKRDSIGWIKSTETIVPDTRTINGKALSADIELGASDVDALPNVSVTTSDNGKFLRVVNGAWAAATVDNANGVSF